MKRRDFLKTTLFAAGIATVVGKTAGLLNNAMAAVVWAKPGQLGYKEVAPDTQVKAGKKCGTCHWYNAGDTAGGAGSGKCTLPAMKGAYVKEAAYCNMWKKKA